MALKNQHWHLLPTWEGSLKSSSPMGYLEGSSLAIDYEKQPSLWFLAADFYKVAKEHGWTKQQAQRELEAIFNALRRSDIPATAAPSAFHRAAVRFVARYRKWGAKLVFSVVVALIEAHDGSIVFNIGNSDRRTQFQQNIEMNVTELNHPQKEDLQARRIRAIVKEALEAEEALREETKVNKKSHAGVANKKKTPRSDGHKRHEKPPH